MRIAFSNAACPELDFDALIAKSKDWGYAGIELKYLDGTFDLTAAPSLKREPELLRDKLKAAGQSLVALNTSLTFCCPSRAKLNENVAKVRQYIDLAGRLRAQFVIVCGDVLPPGLGKPHAIQQTAAALRELAPDAARQGVTLALENIGDLASSRDMWMVHDAVRFPSMRVCWNQVNAQMLREPPSLSIPRLGKSLGLVRMIDATYTADGLLENYVEPGKGQTEVLRMIELLKGVMFDGWLCVEWPRLWQPSLAAGENILPQCAKFLAAELAKKPVELTAYKGDKNAPRWTARGHSAPSAAPS